MSDLLLAPAIFVAALLYSSVGHGGASAYLAMMALAGVAPTVMKPTALMLNVMVSTIGTVRFARAGYFSWRTFAPFAVTSVPFAFLGGMLTLSTASYRVIVGAVLLVAAFRLLLPPGAGRPPRGHPPLIPAVLLGAVIGLLAGLTGVGGGIFLSPLLILTGWAEIRRTAGVSAAFILVNSLAGIAGHLVGVRALPAPVVWWGVAAVTGGVLGAGLGSRRLNVQALRYLLGIVLVIAAVKLFL